MRYYLPAFNKGDCSIDFDGLKGVVLLGSFANVDQKREWQSPLTKTVQKIIDQSIPLLGICYGHQLIAHMHGAKVQQPKTVTEKIVGLKKVEWTKAPSWLKQSDGFWMAASHYQQVLEVPDHFELAASRDDCPVESLAHKSKPIWTTQCHPEASLHFAKTRDMTEGLDRLEHGWGLVRDFLKHALRK
jgi:GMP synthase (glutamine-hydrolysing)